MPPFYKVKPRRKQSNRLGSLISDRTRSGGRSWDSNSSTWCCLLHVLAAHPAPFYNVLRSRSGTATILWSTLTMRLFFPVPPPSYFFVLCLTSQLEQNSAVGSPSGRTCCKRFAYVNTFNPCKDPLKAVISDEGGLVIPPALTLRRIQRTQR